MQLQFAIGRSNTFPVRHNTLTGHVSHERPVYLKLRASAAQVGVKRESESLKEPVPE